MKGKEPDGGIKVPMKYRAICSVCNARIGRMGILGGKAECRACGAMLRLNAKWGWISSAVISFFIVTVPVVIFFLLFPLGYSWQVFVLAFLVMAVVLSLIALIVYFISFPYASKYEIDPKHDKSNEKT